MTLNDREVEDRIATLNDLLERLEQVPGATASMALEAVEALTEIYGEALGRVVSRAGSYPGLAEELCRDELLGHLMLLHDLHPASVEERVAKALDEVRPYIESHGGHVDLDAIEDGVAKVRLSGTCQSCASSTATLELAVRDAVLAAAPELAGVEHAQAPSGNGSKTVISVDSVLRKPPSGPTPWAVLADAGPPERGIDVRTVGGEQVLVLGLDGIPYVYRDRCPACGSSLAAAALEGEELACSECAARFDARRAGRSLDGDGPPLEPIPVLTRDGELRVALAGAPT